MTNGTSLFFSTHHDCRHKFKNWNIRHDIFDHVVCCHIPPRWFNLCTIKPMLEKDFFVIIDCFFACFLSATRTYKEFWNQEIVIYTLYWILLPFFIFGTSDLASPWFMKKNKCWYVHEYSINHKIQKSQLKLGLWRHFRFCIERRSLKSSAFLIVILKRMGG